MAPFVSMLRTTRDHARTQTRAFAGRTRSASAAFATETKHASNDLVRFVRVEARRWGRYVRARSAKATIGARQLFAPKTAERVVLTRVDGTLRALEGRVHDRLASLTTAPVKIARPKRAASKRKAPPAHPSGTTLISGARKRA